MEFEEQQEATFEQPGEGPPALAGVPIHVSFDDPRPYAQQQLPKKRLATVTAAALALVLFGIVWRNMRTGDDAAPPKRAESVLTEQQRTGQSAIDQARELQQEQRERAEEAQRAIEGELTSHDEGGA